MDSQHTSKEMLNRSILSNNIEKVRQLLSQNPELISSKKEDQSPLWLAMLEGHKEVVELLVTEFGANPDEKCKDYCVEFTGCTFLQRMTFPGYFIDMRDMGVAEVLILHGANVNQLSANPNSRSQNQNLLQSSLNRGDLEFSELLLKNGASLRGSEWRGQSPAMIAFGNGLCLKTLTLLLKFGLDTSFLDDSGNNLLSIFFDNCSAFIKTEIRVVEILLDSGAPFESGFSPLHCAIEKGKVELAAFFIEKGADVNRKCEFCNDVPLLFAAKMIPESHYLHDFIELLLSKGADVNAADDEGQTVLHKVCLRIDVNDKLISLLLRKGADVNVEDDDGRTPFSYLARFSMRTHCLPIMMMVKEIAMRNSLYKSVYKTDLKLIQSSSVLLKYFMNCENELAEMSKTKFYASYSYTSVLRMGKNIRKLAKLTKNEEFRLGFKANLSYPLYKNSLQQIFDEAIEVKDDMLVVKSRLSVVFCDFLPEVVIIELTKHLTQEDLPLN